MQSFLRAVIQKLLEKSPIKCKLVRNLKWMQPKAIVEDLNGCLKQLDITLSCLVAINRVNADDCDTIKSQFLQWHTSVVSENSYVFQSFDTSSHRLDTLFKEHLGNSTAYTELWKVTKSLLLLSHGQAQVERGFSVNKETMIINMLGRTLIAKRTIRDHLSSVGGLSAITVTSGMLMAAACARSKYRAHLEEVAEEERRQKLKRKRYDEFEELEKLKAKKARLEKDISSLIDSADKLADKAENTNCHKFLIQSNALRHSAKDKKESVQKLAAEIESKVKEIGGL